MKLENKIVVVTGAAQGMGSTICETLAAEGASLVIAARNREPLDELAAALAEKGTKVAVCPADVTNEDDVINLMDCAIKEFGRIDVLVNAAGATGPVETPIWEIDGDGFDAVVNVNIRGTFLPIKHAVKHMIKQGDGGKIVNIGGGSGLRGYKFRAGYSASKAGVRALTKTTAMEVGEFGINCNAVHPGIVETPRMERLVERRAATRGISEEEMRDFYIQNMVLKRVTTPQDIANSVLFLSCDDSRNMTGQELVVCGGSFI